MYLLLRQINFITNSAATCTTHYLRHVTRLTSKTSLYEQKYVHLATSVLNQKLFFITYYIYPLFTLMKCQQFFISYPNLRVLYTSEMFKILIIVSYAKFIFFIFLSLVFKLRNKSTICEVSK